MKFYSHMRKEISNTHRNVQYIHVHDCPSLCNCESMQRVSKRKGISCKAQ